MQDLSVLTPPLLTCAVVLFAVGAFLRHEMRKKRPEESEHAVGDPELAPGADEQRDSTLTGTTSSADTPRKH